VNGNRLNDDNDYYADLYFSYKALGEPNPSSPSGTWFAPDISSHYWTCGGSRCQFP